MSKPKRYELTPEQWRRIGDLLPGKPSDPGRSGSDNLTFVNGVLWVLRSGAHWHDLPERYGKWKTAHKRFIRWAKAGVWERVFADLIDDPRNDYVSLDSSLGAMRLWHRPCSKVSCHVAFWPTGPMIPMLFAALLPAWALRRSSPATPPERR